MLQVRDEKIPLSGDENGVVRVTGTRVRLDTVVTAFDLGDTPEQIAQSYDALTLDDVYAVITYYLRHRDEVRAYLRARQAQRDEVRREIAGRDPIGGLRERLLKRRAQKRP